MADPSTPPTHQPPTSSGEPKRNRRRLIIFAVVGLIGAGWVVAAALLLPGLIDDLGGDDIVSPPVAAPPADLDDVRTYQDLPTTHRDDEDIDYDVSPPVGGPHDPQWLACGVYEVPVREENVVHDLEHGTVWITYDPDAGLSDAELSELADTLPDNGIMSPYPGLDTPVVVTVWGAQLALEGPDDERLALFIDAYGDGSTSPEPFASCEGGLTDPQGEESVST